MSKTLSIKKPPVELSHEEAEIVAEHVVKTFTAEDVAKIVQEALAAQAVASAAQAASKPNLDPTMDLPTGEIPKHLIADKSALPPAESRASTPLQPPPRLWGKHIAPSPIQHLVADPRTGFPANQAGVQLINSISPPPSRNFRG